MNVHITYRLIIESLQLESAVDLHMAHVHALCYEELSTMTEASKKRNIIPL